MLTSPSMMNGQSCRIWRMTASLSAMPNCAAYAAQDSPSISANLPPVVPMMSSQSSWLGCVRFDRGGRRPTCWSCRLCFDADMNAAAAFRNAFPPFPPAETGVRSEAICAESLVCWRATVRCALSAAHGSPPGEPRGRGTSGLIGVVGDSGPPLLWTLS